MPPEIPTQFKFEVLLSHTFPGFFSALSVFMLLDVLSPYDLTSRAFGTVTNFLSVMGFIIIIGTILGVILDGIHHWIVEPKIFEFERWPKYKRKQERKKIPLYPPGCDYTYYLTRIGKDAFDYAESGFYSYSEFYTNTFISLILSSLIAPFYFCYILKIYWVWSITFGLVVPLVLAYICIRSGYIYYFAYFDIRRDMILGFLDCSYYIEVSSNKNTLCANGSDHSMITAQLKEWKSKKNVLVPDVAIKFKTEDKGELSTQPDGQKYSVLEMKTEFNGETSVYLSGCKPGNDILTASAKDFLPGKILISITP